MIRKVYLDNASTTFVSSEVLAEILPCYNSIYGNSNSVHSFGREASAIVDRARDRIANAINANKSNEIYFTSGGTEADNWAIKGIAHAYSNKGKHIITSSIEHHAVLDSCKQLEEEGYEVTYLPVDRNGLVNLVELLHSIRKDTTLISIIAVNNEVGTIQNIKAIAKIAHDYGIIFHTDAVQAIGNIKIDVQDMEIDALTMSAHKIYGPKGVGCLYLKNGINVALVGRANVGKSSVLNALLGEERAIVTDIEGTTRDNITESFFHKGVKINLIDTAGIRKTNDIVEKLGIQRSLNSINEADIILFIHDGSQKENSEDKEIENSLSGKTVINVVNKTDRPRLIEKLENEIEISALEEKNISKLKDKIVNEVITKEISSSSLVLTNERHFQILEDCDKIIMEIFEMQNTSLDVIAMLIKKLWTKLGQITGNTENEDIISLIFSKFCLGK